MMSEPIYVGMDIGSSYTKVILLNNNKEICGSAVDFSGTDLNKAADKTLNTALSNKYSLSQVSRIISTGYGRKNVQIANIRVKDITEISCAANAARFLYPNKALTIVDIGGQDTKIIKISEENQRSFKMNRKCAAGTGAFLEELALKLRINPEDLNGLAEKAEKVSRVSSYCTVFAGTEILSRIREGEKIEDMIKGAYLSVVKRVSEIDTLENDVLLVGGVIAHHPIIGAIFKQELENTIIIPSSPQLFIALGAALYASENFHPI